MTPKLLRIAFAPVLLAATATAAAAQTTAEPAVTERTPTVRWSVALLGGALAPVRAMRDAYQDALVAGARVGLTTRLGLGVALALDYSPLPRRLTTAATFDTTYGTVALLPGWTLGRGLIRVQLAAGGGVALERTSAPDDPMAGGSSVAPAALGQAALELHVTEGGGLMIAGGATRTFGDGAAAYEYGWAMAGLTLEL